MEVFAIIEIVFSAIYWSLAVITAYLSYSFIGIYKGLPIRTYLWFVIISILASMFSLLYPITYFYRFRFSFDGGSIYILDTILVLIALSFFVLMVYVLDCIEGEGISLRFVIFFGISTAAFVAEFFEFFPWVYLISGSLESLALILFVFFLGRYLLRLRPYVVDRKPFISAVGGLIVIGLGGLFGIILSVLDVYLKQNLIYILSELASLPITMGVLFILYAVTRRPLSPLAIIAYPLTFNIIDRKKGEVIYSYYFRRDISEVEERELKALLEGIYISVSEMFKEELCLKKVIAEKYTINASCRERVMGVFIARKTNKVINEIVDILVEIFEKEVLEHYERGELEKINIEELARFDYIVKYYLTQIAR